MSGNNLEEIKEKVNNRLILAYLSFKLSSESDSWTKQNKPIHKGSGSHLDRSWLFLVVHRTGLIEICAIIEERFCRESANLCKLKNLNFKEAKISSFYNEEKYNIEKVMGIRDKYIGHNDIKPTVDSFIDSHKVTKRLISKVADIMEINLSDYDYHYSEKIDKFARLCLEGIKVDSETPNIGTS